MELRTITLKEANSYVALHHRHHLPVRGHKFSLAVYVADEIHGVAIIGRSVSRILDDGATLEVLRLCTDGYRNACSFLYSASARAAKALGYNKIITYILQSERGVSLIASGWSLVKENIRGRSWNTPSRKRQASIVNLFGETEKYPQRDKKRFEKIL